MFRTTFYGHEISDYGRQNGRVDYHALVSSFDAVLCNSILGYRESWDEWEQIQGFVDYSEQIEEHRAEIEKLDEKIERLEEDKSEIENNLEDLENALENLEAMLETLDSFEYESNELLEALKWSNFETPSGEDIDSDTIEREVESVDFWAIREAIEDHQNTVESERDEASERLEDLNEQLEKFKETRKECEAELEEMECEDTTEREYFQYYIISDSGARILEQEAPSEAVWYNAELDLYVWGVSHWGTAWTHVLTSIPCETYEQTEARERAEAEAEAERKARTEAMTDEEKAEAEAEDLEALLDLWDVDEAEAEDIEAESIEEVAKLRQLDWEVASVGDIVIGKPSASVAYGITTEGWKGRIVVIRPRAGEDTEDPHRFVFDAEGFDNEPNDFEIDPNQRWDSLDSMYFEVYTDEEA